LQIQSVHDSDELCASLFRQLWFVLDCVVKSAACWVWESGRLKIPPRDRFPADFQFHVAELVKILRNKKI
jgi:hypothetical protein